jgi:uncharacterized protein YfiM (DUF2279 family)
MRRATSTALLLLTALAGSAGGQAPAPTDSGPAAVRTSPEPPTPVRTSVSAPAPASDRWLGTDKLRHFVLAGMTQGTAFGVATAAGARARPALLTASAVTAAVSIGKEVVDRRRGGRLSARDLAWDAAGAALWGVLVARSGR